MKMKGLAAIAATLMIVPSTGTMMAQYYGPPQGPPPGYHDQGGWDQAPPEFREVERRGFHDGIEGARHDFDNHRQPDVNNRDEFRHPHVDPADQRAYREAFRRGYWVGVRHIYGPNYGPGPGR